MLVDPQGKFLTQRQLPRMALLDAALHQDQLLISGGDDQFALPADRAAEALSVQVWHDHCQAQRVDQELDRWLSDFLGTPASLVVLPDAQVRQVDQDYAAAEDQVGFADGFPFLLISQASLDELNGRLPSPVPMTRFRPNLVVSGCEAFAEDSWKRIRIGELSFRVVKPCSRCIIPTIDPLSGERAAEPLRTLSSYRRRDNKVYFGQNLLHDGIGELAEGMRVEVLE